MKNLEEIMIAIVRGNYLTAANIELDAFSYPIPRQSGTKMTECFFLYSNQPVTKNYVHLHGVLLIPKRGA